jgi:putative restriction endonuclease
MPLTDNAVRVAAFKWLEEQVAMRGDVLSRERLQEGFVHDGSRIPLLGPPGIFKPQALRDIPLSITTAPRGPYNDSFNAEGLLLYRYRGTDPMHSDNQGLRRAMVERTPLVYFHGIMPGKYLPVWPVFIVGDSPKTLTFTVAVDDMGYVRMAAGHTSPAEVEDEDRTKARRVYVTTMARRRLHQQGFRERVIQAYRSQCACCRLRHVELLDAAHIIPDIEPEGEPIVSNGISLCKLHHAAFDSFIFGITPDYIIHVRVDVLEEADGPMLRHGLQGLDKQKIELPRLSSALPNKKLLEKRYERFKKAG